MTVAIIPCVTAAGSLTRGSLFTVSIAGRPNTAYYIWFARTSAMTGEPGDQPPVIVAYTERVESDPDGGPYTIGSYQFNNGNGRTIRDDVAPSSATTSNTRYYAKVTTDTDGVGIVQFATSQATAQRTFSIRAENPASPGEDVPVRLGLPAQVTPSETPAPATTGTVATLPPVTLLLPAPAIPAVTETSVLPQGTAPLPVPTRPAPAGIVTVLLAAGGGIWLVKRR